MWAPVRPTDQPGAMEKEHKYLEPAGRKHTFSSRPQTMAAAQLISTKAFQACTAHLPAINDGIVSRACSFACKDPHSRSRGRMQTGNRLSVPRRIDLYHFDKSTCGFYVFFSRTELCKRSIGRRHPYSSRRLPPHYKRVERNDTH